jgi:hypothetical protein
MLQLFGATRDRAELYHKPRISHDLPSSQALHFSLFRELSLDLDVGIDLGAGETGWRQLPLVISVAMSFTASDGLETAWTRGAPEGGALSRQWSQWPR